MKETTSDYWVIEGDGSEIKMSVLHRFCGCTSPGCVDDELQIFADGEDSTPYRLQIPRLMTPYIEGLISGELLSEAPDEL